MTERFEAPLQMADAAREACLSPYHFHRHFVRTYGQTPLEFRTMRRIDRAKRLLAEGDLSVTEICFDLDYESVGTFSAWFARIVGCGPTAYQAGTARFYALWRLPTHRYVPTCPRAICDGSAVRQPVG